MRAVFMGTPGPAATVLATLDPVHEIAAVYTQPERPKGRGLQPAPSPVKQAASELGLHVVEPATLKDPEEEHRLAELAPDVVVVVAFGQILPPGILRIPRLGCVNVHFSLLPRWRGAAPIERAIMAGDAVTGVTTMLMDDGLDTGPILLQDTDPILPDDTAGSLTFRLTDKGAALLRRTLTGLEAGTIVPHPQPGDDATHAPKIKSGEAQLDFTRPARQLADQVRALNPHPGAYTWFRGRRLKVWWCEAVDQPEQARFGVGEVAATDRDGVHLQTGQGWLRLVEVQPEGKRAMPVADFVRGHRPRQGEPFAETSGR